MRQVHLGAIGNADLFDTAEQGIDGNPALPAWLPDGPYRAARMRIGNPGMMRDLNYVAVWPDDASVPDLHPADALEPDNVAHMLLAQVREDRHCRACDGRFHVLQCSPLPGFEREADRFVRQCPHCHADADEARLPRFTLAVFPCTNQGGGA